MARNKWILLAVAIFGGAAILYQTFSEEEDARPSNAAAPWFSISFVTSPHAASAIATASSGTAQSRPGASAVVVQSPTQSPSPSPAFLADISLSPSSSPSSGFATPLPSPAAAPRALALATAGLPPPLAPPPTTALNPSTLLPPPPSPRPLLRDSPPPTSQNSPSSAALRPNATIAASPPGKQVPEWRMSLEKSLREAKLAIESASSKNSVMDVRLTKSLYYDVYKFQKSYELMEKLFRVYMYAEGKPNLVHKGPMLGIYASEGWFIHEMNQNTQFVTQDPKAAHMFFLPYSVVHMVTELYVPNSHSMLPLATFIKNYVNEVASKHPFWNMSKGSDHFFVSCHDWGPATARDHPELRKNAVKVVCNADLTEEYVLSKDVSLPETYVHTLKPPPRLGGPGPSKRPILAFFAGQLHGRARPVLLKYWKDKDPDMKIYEKLPREIARRMSYEQHMKSSKFCICAMGYEVNSPRIVESIYYDCVPVIIADNFVLPFSDVINWDAFSITIAEADIPKLKEILLAVPEARYRKMHDRLKRVRKHFVWHDRAEPYDVFHMLLHSVWMRRLQQLEKIASLEQQEDV